jgi:WD40 repeat protein
LGKIRYFGDYELIEEIARGGMGVVYKAKQVSLNRVVALKMILKGEFASEADVRRFRQEAEAAANLDHPNIVPIYEVGEHEGQQYFSMKLISVVANSEWRGASKDGQRQVATMLAKVARAVHHAHQRGILHRDLKPSNILIDTNGEPHVADFGLAKKVEGGDDATKSGAIVGTPAYMAPEQARAEKSLTTAVDVWSLGAILYEWLTGRPPFRGDDPVSTLMKVVSDEPVKPRSVDTAIDRDLETICLKCLEKEPAKRFGSAQAIAEDLDKWIRGEPISARPVTRTERTWRWCRRNPVLAALTATVVLAVIAMSLGSWWAAWHFNQLASLEQSARKKADDAKTAESEQRQRAEGERDAKAKALQNAEALRLIALSQVEVPRHPVKALELAVEGAKRADPRTATHNNAVAAAFEKVYENRRYEAPVVPQRSRMNPKLAFTSVAYSRNGKYLAATTGRAFLDGPFGGTWEEHQAMIWDRETGGLVRTIRVPGLGITKVVFSADCRKILTLHEGYGIVRYEDKREILYSDQAARLWDIVSGKELRVFGGHKERITFAEFSVDGKHLVTGGWDGVARVWNPETGELLHQLHTEQGELRTIHLSQDGKRLLTVSEGSTHVSSAEKQALAETSRGFPKERNPLVRKDAKVESIGGYGGVSTKGPSVSQREDRQPARLWDLASGKEIATLRLPEDGKELQASTSDAVFDEANGRVITWHYDGTVRFWDAVAGKHQFTTPSLRINGYRLRANALGIWCIAANSELVKLDGATGKEMARWTAFDRGFGRIRWSNEQPHILFVGSDRSTDRDMQWLGGHRHPGHTSPPAFGVAVCQLAQFGEQIALLQGHEDEILDAAFDPTGHEVVTASRDGTLREWFLQGKQLYANSKWHGNVSSIAFINPAGDLYSAGQDGAIRKNEVASLRVLKTFDHSGIDRSKIFHRKPVTQIELSPNGERLVSLADDHFVLRTFDKSEKPDPKVPFTPVKIWDAKTGGMLHALQGFTCGVRSVAFSPDGKSLLTVSAARIQYLYLNEKDEDRGVREETSKDLGVRLWNPKDGKLLGSLPVEFYCRAAVWSPDSSRIATTHPLKVWDAGTQREALALERHDVDRLHWSADGRWIVGWQQNIIADRQQVVVWDAGTGKIRYRLDRHGGDVLSVALSKDGERLAVATAEGKIHLWNLSTGTEIRVYEGFNQPIQSLAFSISGRWLAVGSKDGLVRIWETASANEWLTINTNSPLNGLRFSPNDQALAIGGGSLFLWPTDPLRVAEMRLDPLKLR